MPVEPRVESSIGNGGGLGSRLYRNMIWIVTSVLEACLVTTWSHFVIICPLWLDFCMANCPCAKFLVNHTAQISIKLSFVVHKNFKHHTCISVLLLEVPNQSIVQIRLWSRHDGSVDSGIIYLFGGGSGYETILQHKAGTASTVWYSHINDIYIYIYEQIDCTPRCS